MNKEVKVISSPVSERYAKKGTIGTLDEETSKIRVGGAWFDFDNRWEVEEIKEEVIDSTVKKVFITPVGTEVIK